MAAAFVTRFAAKRAFRSVGAVVSCVAPRRFGSTFGGAAIKLPELAYGYGDLEPVISGDIMELHHGKHHQAYVNNLKAALEKMDEAVEAGDDAAIAKLGGLIKFHGGGHINHSILWTNLAPPSGGGGGAPSGDLGADIESQWGSFDAFKDAFDGTATGVQGSGWCWLGYNSAAKKLEITTTANQDTCTNVPLYTADVWEHAHYLQYKNLRPAYLKALWGIVNWDNVAERYAAAKA